MGHCAVAVGEKVFGNGIETSSAADGGFPSIGVHGKTDEVLEVDYYCASVSSTEG
jgi:hypothetical protein